MHSQEIREINRLQRNHLFCDQYALIIWDALLHVSEQHLSPLGESLRASRGGRTNTRWAQIRTRDEGGKKKNRKKNIPRFPFQDVSSDSRERERKLLGVSARGETLLCSSSSSDGDDGDGVGVNEEESSHAHYVAN